MLDRLGTTIQHTKSLESEHYDKLKIVVVKLCKASAINFSLIYSANINMAIKKINKSREMTKTGTFKDGTYFDLEENARILVDERAK